MPSVLPNQIEMIPMSRITVLKPRARNKRQHREIVNNIEAIGLKRPITVSRRDGPGGPHYDLVCGEGRLEAFQMLGQTEIPAVVIEASESECLVMSLVENIARRTHLAVIAGYAPKGDALESWWEAFIRDLGPRLATWSWPTEAEVLSSAQSASKKHKPSETDWTPDVLAIAIRRMETGEPIAESWLWGSDAVKLIGRIGEARVQERRDHHAGELANFYAIEVARTMILALEDKHKRAVEAAANPCRSGSRRMPEVVIKSVRGLLGPGPEYVVYHAENVDIPAAKSSEPAENLPDPQK